ncbi:netrin receptor DCC [Elysia marginata]|uniref:Netrin receptor DCC n=1 Tax=Elysia marginata TaxID=1093978 RepID=A0AAV4G717_9GAST|nr:netrin receptor DCC [Elysia marginata]
MTLDGNDAYLNGVSDVAAAVVYNGDDDGGDNDDRDVDDDGDDDDDEAVNDDNGAGSSGQDLSSIPEFHFIREPAVTTLTRSGTAATLDCVVAYDGLTKPDIHWIREAGEGQPGIRLDDNSVRYTLSNGSLYFKRVNDASSTGSYRCGATVPGVGTIVSRAAYLDVTYIRKPLLREPTDLALAPGDTAAFECLAEASPQAKVTWFKGDVQVHEGQGHGVHIYPTGERPS